MGGHPVAAVPGEQFPQRCERSRDRVRFRPVTALGRTRQSYGRLGQRAADNGIPHVSATEQRVTGEGVTADSHRHVIGHCLPEDAQPIGERRHRGAGQLDRSHLRERGDALVH